jgi:CRP/FNR family transcriptional regulator, anaerobic regulatory protein
LFVFLVCYYSFYTKITVTKNCMNQSPLAPLFSALDHLHPLSDVLRDRLNGCVNIRYYPKNHILLKKDDVSRHLFFVLKGMARAYYIKKNVEITVKFLFEGAFISSPLSLLQNRGSNEYVDMIEDTFVAAIHYDDLQQLCEDFGHFDYTARKITEGYLQQNETRNSILSHTGVPERIGSFYTRFPVGHRIPRHLLASYLDISEKDLPDDMYSF